MSALGRHTSVPFILFNLNTITGIKLQLKPIWGITSFSIFSTIQIIFSDPTFLWKTLISYPDFQNFDFLNCA